MDRGCLCSLVRFMKLVKVGGDWNYPENPFLHFIFGENSESGVPPHLLHLFTYKPRAFLPQFPCLGKIFKVFKEDVRNTLYISGFAIYKGKLSSNHTLKGFRDELSITRFVHAQLGWEVKTSLIQTERDNIDLLWYCFSADAMFFLTLRLGREMACSTARILDLFFNWVCNDKKELKMVQHWCGNTRWQHQGAPSMLTSGKHIKMGNNWKSRDQVRTNPLFITKSSWPKR